MSGRRNPPGWPTAGDPRAAADPLREVAPRHLESPGHRAGTFLRLCREKPAKLEGHSRRGCSQCAATLRWMRGRGARMAPFTTSNSRSPATRRKARRAPGTARIHGTLESSRPTSAEVVYSSSVRPQLQEIARYALSVSNVGFLLHTRCARSAAIWLRKRQELS